MLLLVYLCSCSDQLLGVDMVSGVSYRRAVGWSMKPDENVILSYFSIASSILNYCIRTFRLDNPSSDDFVKNLN